MASTPNTPEIIDHDGSEELQLAYKAACVGGKILSESFGRSGEVRFKGEQQSYDLVTDTDVASEKAICECIREHFPEHEILGEEGQAGDVQAEHLWIVDPLDGTNNFVHRIPHFAVSIAYYHCGQAKCGVVYNPVRDDCYWADAGGGAFHNGLPMHVSPTNRLDESLVACGFFYDRGAMMEATLAAIHAFFRREVHGIRRFGTASLDLCQVADGLFGVFFEYQLAPWDFAAGRLIVEEAGGKVTDGMGDDLALRTTSLLASNSRLHAEATKIVAEHHPLAN